ncbi:MAG TPA: polyphenol oxidase family protein [Solirubrobacteraceae bacterium]
MTAFTWREGHLAIDLPAASVVFTTRRGGESAAPYDTLNLGLWTEDDPGAVAENRRRLADPHGLALLSTHQVHGTDVVRAERAHDSLPDADGHATATPGLAPLVVTADCLPVAVAADGAVAVLHCGWRGLAGGIVAEGVRAVRELGGDGEVHAAIGPGAGPCCYEVGDEVRAAFAAHGDAVRRGRRIDLKAIAARELEAAGAVAVHDTAQCTICGDPALWFSHRREGARTGRQGGMAWLR